MKRLLLALGLSVAALGGVLAVSASAVAAVCPDRAVFCYWNAYPPSSPVRLLPTGCREGVYFTSYVGPVGWTVNDCPTRVWLHQYTDGTGATFCVSPMSDGGETPANLRYPGNILVSANPNPC